MHVAHMWRRMLAVLGLAALLAAWAFCDQATRVVGRLCVCVRVCVCVCVCVCHAHASYSAQLSGELKEDT